MEISYFREFVILAETLNYWSAADRLYIGESSLSKHIKTLEKQLGGPLFDRSSRQISLTEYGRKMLPYAQSIAKLQHEYETMTFNYLHAENETLNIASIPVMAQYHIIDMLIQFNKSFPQIHLNTVEDDTLLIREWLIEQKCDVAFIRDSVAYLEHNPDHELQLTKIPYCRDYLVALLPKSHPLAGQKQLELPQLAGENFALLRKETMPYNLCIRACREAGFVPHVFFTSHNLDSIVNVVSTGNCISLLFHRHAALAASDSFVSIPVTPQINTTIYLAYRKNSEASPVMKCFIDHCKAFMLQFPLE